MQHPATKPITRKVSGRVFTVDVPVKWEPEENDYSISLDDALAAELAIARALAVEGPVDGESFAYMRRTLGLPQTRLAAILDVAQETVSRWENGVVALPRSAWLTLSSLVMERAGRGPSELERIEALAVGGKPPREVHLTL